ncbi:MAG: hypothetical protein NZM10_07750 [Fimbriimonadales bacterium]|nr:hypothetical protein [Fimbriimonadales bacterium]
MPIRFLKNASEIADVSWQSPLPVRELDKERKLVQVDALLIRTLTVDTTQRDLFGNTASSNPDLPTLDNCLKYHTLLWTGYRTGTAAVNYLVQARCGDSLDADSGGDPLGTGWLDITQHTLVYNTDGVQGTAGTIGGAAAGHFRVVIRLPDGLYFDQYRIVVWQSSGSQIVHHKLVGVRR